MAERICFDACHIIAEKLKPQESFLRNVNSYVIVIRYNILFYIETQIRILATKKMVETREGKGYKLRKRKKPVVVLPRSPKKKTYKNKENSR